MPASVDFPAPDFADLIASGAYPFIAKVDDVGPVTDLEDVIDRDTLEPLTDWTHMGMAREGQGSNYEQNVTTTELRLDQLTAVVFENITETTRTIQLQLAEFSPDKLALLEESEVTNAGGLWSVEGGILTFRSHYRVALLGRREPGQGRDITNSAGKVRGEIIGTVLQNATISAGANQFELQRGQLANLSPTFKGYPDADTGVVVVHVGETGPETLGS